MHVDEYEISLSRELAVCKSAMKRIKEFLAIYRKKAQHVDRGLYE